jgi:type II secretory pathway pseudopilin PulG
LRRRCRRGIALLEALVALAIVATAGLGFLTVMRQALAASQAAGERERRLAAADRVLGAMTLLRRNELEQRIGLHPVGEFVVQVSRPERTVFRIAVSEAAAPGQALLVTLVYRPARKLP